MAAIFWSHANSYVGDYSIVRRTPHKEFTEGYHYHDFYEAQFYFNNDPETKDEPLGTIMLGDEMYKPKNGDVFLINMFDSHYIQMDNKKHYDRYCVSISPTLMLFICSEHSNLFNIYNKSNRNYPLMHMTEHQQQLFLQMYHDFEVRLKDMEHGKRFLEQSLLFGIIAQLYDIYYTETQIAPTDSLHMSTLTTLVRYIDEHIAEDLSLKQLSEVTNFSTYHQGSRFQQLQPFLPLLPPDRRYQPSRLPGDSADPGRRSAHPAPGHRRHQAACGYRCPQ